MDVRYDTAVIGAGLAGLRTADLLRRAGRTTVVLEAADRVGGRLLRQTVAGVAVDGGGAWVGPRQRRVQALIAELVRKGGLYRRLAELQFSLEPAT